MGSTYMDLLIEFDDFISFHGIEAFNAAHTIYGSDLEVMESRFLEDSYWGPANSMTELAKKLRPNEDQYFDYKAFANDLRCSGEWAVESGYAFRIL